MFLISTVQIIVLHLWQFCNLILNLFLILNGKKLTSLMELHASCFKGVVNMVFYQLNFDLDQFNKMSL